MEPLVLEYGLEYRGIKGDFAGIFYDAEARSVYVNGSIFSIIK
jgi:hypothetical protein